MHHFLTFKNFPETALKFGAYYFQSNLANIAIAQVWVLDKNLKKIEKKPRVRKDLEKRKIVTIDRWNS